MPEIQDSKFQDTSKYATKCQNSYEIKDETAANREIATLLLNLASRTQSSAPKSKASAMTTSEPESAMDLSNYTKSSGVSKSMKVSSSSQSFQPPHVPSTVNPYSLLPPSLALPGMSNTPMAASLGSSYLLQNLLIGQMQQMVTPHHPVVKQPTAQSSQKTPQNLKLSDSSAESKPGNTTYSTSKHSTVYPLSSSVNSLLSAPSLTNTTIPLLSGQIVAQLNSLLFSVHGIADKSLEMNVQGQLAAIYTRLQEIVAMIALSKKKEMCGKSQPVPELDVQKPLNIVTNMKEKEEQKIARQLEEYQKALIQSKSKVTNTPKQSENVFNNKYSTPNNVATILRNQAPNTTESLRQDIPSTKPQEEALSPDSVEYHEDRSSSPDTRRRLSRDSFPDSPPEKRVRLSMETTSMSTVSCTSPQSVGRSKGGGKGGKGIRNRVFCGDCAGCLKNDDCGQCRYCRDKTKFGGQNRLRQKCLHRRCQMDTHRRSNGSAASHPQPQPTQSDSISTNPGIYSGVDLARFATQQHSGINDAVGPGDVFSSILGNVPTISGDGPRVAQTNKDGDRDTPDREDSKDREVGEQQQSRSDKWKAKHEAMLKLASGPTPLNDNTKSHKKERLNTEEKLARQQIFENSSLVITVKEPTTENDENVAVNKQNDAAPLRPKVSVEPCIVTKTEKSQHKVKYIDRSSKVKSIDSVKETGRLTTRSMKSVLAV